MQIARCKEVIRECVQYCDEAEGDAPIPQVSLELLSPAGFVGVARSKGGRQLTNREAA